jgi:hypothetical protein
VARARAHNRPTTTNERIALAEGVLRIQGDIEAARDLLQDVPQPSLAEPGTATGTSGFTPFWLRYRLNRLLGQMGDTREISALVPIGRLEDEGLALFERNVVLVARLAGQAAAGRKTSAASFLLDVRPTLRLFSRPPGPEWRFGWHVAQAGRAGLYELLIFAARRYGAEVADGLRTAFEEEWTRPETKQYWSPETVRSVILSFGEAGAPNGWLVDRLAELDAHTGQSGDITSRVQDALKQVQALLHLGVGVSADQMYRRLLGLTHGVGYQDGQLKSWIHWAELASRMDSAGSETRFGQLASGLPQLRDSLEDASGAVVVLLGATTRWTPEAGFALLRWCLYEGLVSFAAGVEAVLAATIEHCGNTTTAVHAAYRWLLLPLDFSSDDQVLPHLARRMIEQKIAAGGQAEAATAVHDLARAIIAAAAPSYRYQRIGLLEAAAHSTGVTGVDESLKTRAKDTREREPDSTSSLAERDVDYFDGLPTPKSDILRRTESVAGVVDLVSREKPESLFSWAPAIRDLIARANASEVSILAEAFSTGRAAPERRWEIDLLLARRRVSLADRSGAWDLAERAFNEAPAFGWLRYYDGGSRLRCLEVLTELDSERAGRIAFDALTAELGSGRLSLRDLATALHRVLPAMATRVPVLEIWPAIALHVGALFKTDRLPTHPLALRPTGRTPSNAVLNWIADYLSHPTYQLAWGAQRAFVDLCRVRDADAVAVLAERLIDPRGPHTPILLVLTAVAEVDLPTLAPFVAALEGRLRSADFAVRMHSKALLDRLRAAHLAVAATVDPPTTTEARPVFDLALPPAVPSRRLREQSSNEPLAETDDPSELVVAFAPEIEALSALANVQPEALSTRVTQIARELDPGGLLESTERQLRTDLDGAKLLLPFRRPRAVLIRRALDHAVAEMLDMRRLPASKTADAELILRRFDPRMLILRPGLRPAAIAPLYRGRDGYFREEWFDDVTIDPSALFVTPLPDSGGIVLAEETHLRWLASGRPTEVRVGARVRGYPDRETLQSADLLRALCERWLLTTSAEYLQRKSRTNSLIILQDGYSLETPAQRWLAFNPSVARALGWSPSADGIFRWTDASGAPMVESLWWEDGCPDLSSLHPDEVVGHGWLVVASTAGASMLGIRFGRLTACARIERRKGEDTISRVAEQRLDV